jgi:hypothetical protein
LFLLGRHGDAAGRLRDRLRAGDLPLTLAEAAEVLTADGGGVADLVTLVPQAHYPRLVQALTGAPVELADELLDAMWAVPEKYGLVVIALAQLAGELPPHRALTWSGRVRELGFAHRCPLVGVAANRDRPAAERALLAALAVEFFADPAAAELLGEALERVPDAEAEALLARLREVAPGVAAALELTPAAEPTSAAVGGRPGTGAYQ